MKLVKMCMVLAALLFTYVFISNYEMLDFVFVTKERVGFRFPTNLFYKEARRTIDLKLPIAENGTTTFKDTAKEPNESIKLIDHIQPIESIHPTHAVLPTYDTYEAMLDDDAHASNSRTFPGHSSCPYQGLRKPLVTSVSKNSQIPAPICHRRLLTPSDCKDVIKYFGQYGTMKAGQCDTNNAVKICTISEAKSYKREEIHVSCDGSSCKGKIISLGLFSDTIGKIKWRQVKDMNRLNALLKNHIISSSFAPGFALLKCGRGIQILSFPKILKRVEPAQRQETRKPLNINIILEDSLARGHFYRTLLKTASTFRDIVYNQSIPSTLLEFEKVQSYASNTYNSLQRMFTAQKYFHAKTNCEYGVEEFIANDTKSTCTYGVEEMFARYRRAGYSTLLQEDHCWFDDWGSFLDPRKRLGRVKDERTRLSRWNDFVKLVQKSGRGEAVEDYGMSILTCDAYKKYKVTNPFSSRTVPNVCFAGRHYASFFLEYVKKYTELNDMAAQPFIAYTHLLTSHDTNGRRIVNDDESLADLFRHAAHLRNTVTIFASDHGAKATHFAAYTTQGRQEVFQPLLFMIVPHEVSKLLGPEAMNALVLNQNRLVGVEDLYHSLASIVESNLKTWDTNADPNKKSFDPHADPIPQIWGTHADPNGHQGDSNARVKQTRLRGLFKPVPLDRTCKQMKISSVVLCLCDGMDNSVPNESQTVKWAAEFALGTLNNRIQEQYTTALRSERGMLTSDFYGYGACQRYIGTGVMSARHIVVGVEQKLLFSLLARPIDRKTVEIFDVELTFAMKKNGHGITLNNLIRVSPFNEYEKCTDKGVDPKLCTCHPDYSNNTLWRNEFYSKVISQVNFELKPQTQILDDPCLVIITRVKRTNVGGHGTGPWQNAIETYEAVNRCPNVIYKLVISFKKSNSTRVSLKYPGSVTLLPRTVTFLLTAKNDWKYGWLKLRFRFEKSTLTQ